MELKTMRSLPTTAAPGRKKAGGSNDLFEKCRNFTRPGDLQAAGLYMYFEVFGERDGCGPGEVRIGKRKVLMVTPDPNGTATRVPKGNIWQISLLTIGQWR